MRSRTGTSRSGLSLALALATAVVGCTERGDHSLYTVKEAAGCADVDPVPTDIATIFDTSCAGSSCHTNGGSSGKLALDSDVAAANLVGVKASADSERFRVVPKAPGSSYLVLKVRGDPSAGAAMPLGTAGLGDADVAALEAWVNGLDECDLEGGTDTGGGVKDVVDDVVEPMDDGPPMDAPPVQVDPVPAAVAAIFAASCGTAGCHTEGGQSGGLMLDAAVAAENLVSIPAQSNSSVLRVVPKDPDNSFLIQKLRGDVAPQMPLGKPALGAEDMKTIEDWILSLEEGGGPPPDGDVVEPDADTGGPTPIECTPKNDTYTVTYGDLVAIVKGSCSGTGCHTDGGTSGGLSLDDDGLSQNTIGVAATSGGGLFRIHPGDPSQSYLYQKLTGDAAPQMPLGGPALTTEQIEMFQEWIEDCASPKAEKGVGTGK